MTGNRRGGMAKKAAAGAGGSDLVVDIDLNNNVFRSIDEFNFNVTGNFRMEATGAWVWTGDFFGSNENGTWGTPTGAGQGDPFHCRLVFISGSNDYVSGAALNTWFALTGNSQWNFMEAGGSGPNQSTGTWRIDVSDDGGSTTLDSQQFTVTMEEQSP